MTPLWKPTVTPHETRLCVALRSLKIACTQNPKISGYYPDIAITGTNILIEVDGSIHASPEAKAHDRQRTHHLKLAGFRVIRVSNRQIDKNLRGVVAKIQDAIAKYQSGRSGIVFRGNVDPKAKERARRKAKTKGSRSLS